MTYHVCLYTPYHHSEYELADARTVGSPGAARLCAESLLAPHAVTTTWALRGHVRSSYVTVTNAKGDVVGHYDAPVNYVDSIGDRLRRGETVVV